MKKTTFALIFILATFGTNSSASPHGGGLDWQGGHNCRVGSCAGTYHCHQARAGVCAPKVKATKKPSTKKSNNR